jgi:succinyl-diaminopimelate desuccinylase
LRAAREDYDAVVELTRRLVRVPSRGGIDPCGPVLECMSAWLGEHGLACRRVAGPGGATVALTCEVPGGRPGPRFVLDACLDTAPFGDEAAWTYPPTSGQIAGVWLHGRGSSDSKAGAAIFAHVAARLRETVGGFDGSVVLLFDVDEHTGGFGGAKAYFEHAGPVDGVMIGYPGSDHVVTGGRGVLRARVHVHDVAGQSGSTWTGAGAITKAAYLIRKLHQVPLPGPPGPEFPLPAKLTVTAISGGEGYSMIPDLCTVNIDIRLTPALDDPAAIALLQEAAASTDAAWPGTPPTDVEVTTRWPPYALPDSSPLRDALLRGATRAGMGPVAKVAGPSNIGNYLAGLGVPATAGLGVDYKGLHGTDERIRLDSIPAVQAAYHHALLTLLPRPFQDRSDGLSQGSRGCCDLIMSGVLGRGM